MVPAFRFRSPLSAHQRKRNIFENVHVFGRQSGVLYKIGLLQKTTDPPEFFESRHPVALLWSWRKKKNKKKKEEEEKEEEEEEDTISRVMSNTIPITSKNQTTPNTVKEYARIRVFFDILH